MQLNQGFAVLNFTPISGLRKLFIRLQICMGSKHEFLIRYVILEVFHSLMLSVLYWIMFHLFSHCILMCFAVGTASHSVYTQVTNYHAIEFILIEWHIFQQGDILKVLFLSPIWCSQVVNSGGFVFKSWLGDHLFWQVFLWFSSISLDRCWNSRGNSTVIGQLRKFPCLRCNKNRRFYWNSNYHTFLES
jgi:hypothetical protein